VFYSDLEAGVPAEFSATGAFIDGVEGYEGLGSPDNQFSTSFLRYTDIDLFDTTLTLTGLPPHSHLSLGFLLALIDSWDGTELLQVRVDGALLFSHWFQLATGDVSSYVAPPDGLLSSGTNLGFSSGQYYGRGRAYDMSVEPAFQNIPHTADSVTIVWSLSAVSGSAAENWQGEEDESWAIDNVHVSVTTLPGTGAGTVDGLTVQRGVGGMLELSWNPSCLSGDSDYAVYDGFLGSYASHIDILCSTAAATFATVSQVGGDSYFLVVARNSSAEGSHGLRSDGSPRPRGPSACVPQIDEACP
jgi:hypothetical protein